MLTNLKNFDPEVAQAVKNELRREREGAELIASENFVSRAVLETMGTVLTNKYSEGYPNKRYYGGNEFVDITEQLAIDRAKQLFGAEHVNVQPHAGSQANMAAYMAILKPGDKILGMDLAHGGHLTHGCKVNFSGKLYNFSAYGVNEDNQMLDMEKVREVALQEKPKMLLAGFSAYPREINFPEFRKIADEVSSITGEGCYLMADVAHIAGLIAAKIHSDPIPCCDIVTTTTHKTLRGPRGAIIMCKTDDRLKHIYDPEGKKNLARKIDSAVFPGMQGGPLDHMIAAKAVAFKEALQPSFVEYQKQIVKNAAVLAETLMENDVDLVSGGTDNHLILIDLTKTGLGGKEVESALDKAHLFTNKNMIPFDKRSPFDPSGIRIGTPALTTRGFKEDEMVVIGESIAKVIRCISDPSAIEEVKQDILSLCKDFPLYPDMEY
ncbi:serine hydroxymethyltransferase [Candidatus Woesearchaeota archaeon]|jgi:glycine hydroxymethyltransferase|nr:serine hydroxymethyltransferase [Candidatus Woesearchaeota archaeon]MBT5272325.1 serine hydroxymethyltransferase [Candidatus Woesearchaeota archaeon]MBT6040654.1 serine hydroxymethyltransferase [Candidatus Woesearchaeota archaeon]MBT6336597.1 serine hydroxymethyltransferase [Candidatus Woesearchaeota archaeon]MBT7927487.1 serine hydroxymethyltransferase [Candidatus Woesearchaeota archaeon]